MTILEAVGQRWDAVLLWGGVATVVMTTVLDGARVAGFSRLSLPLLFGTFVTGNRRRAELLGYALYALGGWLFAFVYAMLLESVWPSWWLGLLAGLSHGVFLVVCFLTLLAHVHPRVATRYEGPTARRRLEPPGPLGLNYGRATPATTILAHALYGLIFGAGYGHGVG